jgi:hypothetical protein
VVLKEFLRVVDASPPVLVCRAQPDAPDDRHEHAPPRQFLAQPLRPALAALEIGGVPEDAAGAEARLEPVGQVADDLLAVVLTVVDEDHGDRMVARARRPLP